MESESAGVKPNSPKQAGESKSELKLPFSDRAKAAEAGRKSGEARRAKGQAGPVEAVREGPSQQLRDYRWVWENEEGPDVTAGRRRARKAFEGNQGKFEDRLERMEREHAGRAVKAVESGAGPAEVDVGHETLTGAGEKWLAAYGEGEAG